MTKLCKSNRRKRQSDGVGRVCPRDSADSFALEPLEPRLLLAADLAAGLGVATDWDRESATVAEVLEQVPGDGRCTALQCPVSPLAGAIGQDVGANAVEPLHLAEIGGLLGSAFPKTADGADAAVNVGNGDTEADHPADPLASAPRSELVFVDAGVVGYEQLLDDLGLRSAAGHELEVHLLDAQRDGVEQIASVLGGYRGLDAIHILSHGAAGQVRLGSATLSAGSLQGYAGQLNDWGSALADSGDVLIYGCDLAAGDQGRALVDAIGIMTGADVAASVDQTGSAARGGDWDLEYRAGEVETAAWAVDAAYAQWTGVLASGTEATILFTTDRDVTGSGVPGLDAWSESEVLELGDPGMGLGPGATAGAITSLVDLGPMGLGSGGIDAIHYVGSDLTVGGANAVTLQPGDLLLSVENNGVTLTSTNSIGVDDADVFVFRPDTPGDYSQGTFTLLLDGSGLSTPVADITLVEHQTLVGDAILEAGSFLFAAGGGSDTNSVFYLVPADVGPGTTAASETLLIDGSDVGIDRDIVGIDLIESGLNVGGVELTSGQILVTLLQDDAAVGDTPTLATTAQDVFVLDVTTTGIGSTAATATLLLDGDNVRLDTTDETLTGISLLPATTSVLAVDDLVTTSEDGAVLIDVLANDSGVVTLLDHSLPKMGSLIDHGDGTFTYTPDPDYNGDDTFAYLVSDGTDGTSHYWRLDGDAVDEVGGNDGTLDPSVTTTTGHYGQALHFDDTVSGIAPVSIPDFGYAANTTVSFRFKVDDNSGTVYQYFYSHANAGTANSLNVYLGETGNTTYPDQLVTYIRDGDDDTNAAALNVDVGGGGLDLVGDGQWHCYTLTIEAGVGSKVYIDGVLRASAARGDGGLDPVGPLILGGPSTGTAGRYYGGDLDSLQVIDQALDATGVADLYGGITAARDSATVTILIDPVNDAPAFGAGQLLAAVDEDTADPAGATVNALFSGTFSDPADGDGLAGIAIAGNAADAGSEGRWQYTTDGGTNWYDVGSPTTDAALLIQDDGANTRLRFVPVADFNGTPGALAVHAVDDSSPTDWTAAAARQTFDTTADDATSRVSAAGVSLGTSITAANDAPGFGAGQMLAAVDEDTVSPTGETVNALFSGTFSDPDGDGFAGIAIGGNAADAGSEGRWQYTTDGGANWYDIGSPVTASALLIQDDGSNTRLRFVPVVDFNGTPGTLTVHAVDDSSPATWTVGAATQTFDTTADGATSPVSAAGVSLGTSITPTNDNPTVTLSGTFVSYTENGPVKVLDPLLTIGDIDGDDLVGATVRLTSNHTHPEDVLSFTDQLGISGSWDSATGTLTLTGNASVAAYQTALRSITYHNTSENPNFLPRGTEFIVQDAGSSSTAATGSISVVSQADAPTLDLDADDSGGTLGNDYAVTFTEGDGPLAIADVDTAVADVDGSSIAYVRLAVSGLIDGGDEVLLLDGTSFDLSADVVGQDTAGSLYTVDVTTGAGSADVTVTKRGGGDFTHAETATLIESIRYQHLGVADPAAGDRVLVLRINDTGVSSSPATATVTVVAVNDAPTLAGGPYALPGTDEDTVSVGERVATVLAGLSTGDADGDSLGLAITAASGSGSWQYSTDSTDGSDGAWTGFGSVSPTDALLLSGSSWVRFQPDGMNGETVGIDFHAWDGSTGTPSSAGSPSTADPAGGGGTTAFSSGTAQASLAVAAVNDAPVLDPIGDRSVDEGNTLTFTATASDADLPADTLTYGLDAASLALGMTIDANTGAFSWTPTEGQGGLTPSVTVTVTDDGIGNLVDAEIFTVTVNGTNSAPVLDPIGNKSVDEGATLSFTATATDSDLPADTLTFSLDAASIALGMTIDANTGAFSWTPTEAQGGLTPSVTVTVTDSGTGDLVDSETFTIGVNDVNDAPVISSDGAGATAAVEAAENQVAVTTVTAADADLPADALTFAISGGADAGLFGIDPASGRLFFSSARDFETPTDADLDGVYQVEVQVSDGAASDVQLISVAVTDVNEAPEVSLSAASTSLAENIDTSSRIKVADIHVGDDALGGNLLTLAGADAALFEIDGTALFLKAGTVVDFELQNAYAVAVQVDDPAVGAAPDGQATLLVGVLDVNDAPVLDHLEPGAASYTAGGPPVAVSLMLTVDDQDDTHIAWAVVRFGANYHPGEDLLRFADTATISGSWDAATGTLTLSGADTVAAYQAALRSVTYENLADAPDTGARKIALTVGDGDAPSNTVSRDIAVTDTGDGGALQGIGPADPVALEPVSAPATPIVGETAPVPDLDPFPAPDPAPDAPAVELSAGAADEGQAATQEPVTGEADGEPAPRDATEASYMAEPPSGVDHGKVTTVVPKPGLGQWPGRDAVSLLVRNAALLEGLAVAPREAVVGSIAGALSADALRAQLQGSGFTSVLDRMQDDLARQAWMGQVAAGGALATTTSLAVGYVMWLFRGGALLSGFLSSMAAWQLADPLPVLAHALRRGAGGTDDEDSLESLVQKGARDAREKRGAADDRD